MLKKSLIAGAGSLLVLGLLFGRGGWSYISTSLGQVRENVKRNVPVDFEIERARKMIKDLDPEIRRNMHLIAKEEVEVEKLEHQVSRRAANLARDREQIFRLKTDLDSGGDVFYYAGRRYSSNQVKTDLANRFARFKTDEETGDKLQQILNARRKGLEAAREKLEGMLAAKRQLEVEVENLEARLKMVEVAKTTSEFNFDDSHLARTRELIDEIATRIDVEAKLADANIEIHDEIPLDEEPESVSTTDNISDEIASYFGERPAERIAAYAGEE